MTDPRAAADFIDRATDRPSLGGMARGLFQYRELVRNLVRRDLMVKYRGSILGLAWSLMNPLVLVAASTLAFKYILRVGPDRYPLFVFLGLIAWSFFTNAANMSTRSVIDGAGLLKSVRFPRAVLPVATVLFNLAQYAFAVAVFLPLLLLVYGIPAAAPLIAFPAMLALQVAFTTGVALLLSAATVYFRDVRHLTEVTLSVLFWTTPVVYPLSQVSDTLRPWIRMSPLSPFIAGYHRIVFDGQWPEPALWLLASAYAAVSLGGGALIFLRLEDRLGERL